MASIIANVPPTTPVDTFDFSGNLLTAVPANLPQFNQLANLNLANNSIAAVATAELNLPAAVKSLDLSSNQISTIATSSLPGIKFIATSHRLIILLFLFINFFFHHMTVSYANDALIKLDDNKLLSFDQGVFGPIIRGFITNKQTGNSISVAKSKSITSQQLRHYKTKINFIVSLFFQTTSTAA